MTGVVSMRNGASVTDVRGPLVVVGPGLVVGAQHVVAAGDDDVGGERGNAGAVARRRGAVGVEGARSRP